MTAITTGTLLDPPRRWANQPLVLYHGTTAAGAAEILRSGVRVSRGREDRDFGRGFYSTTVRKQADQWAWSLAHKQPGATPAVIELTIDRDELSHLETLCFVRGDRDAVDFWSLVVHCRSRRVGHGRLGSRELYDVVIGPVAAFWKQRVTMHDSDQISFHTVDAEKLLNSDRTARRRVW